MGMKSDPTLHLDRVKARLRGLLQREEDAERQAQFLQMINLVELAIRDTERRISEIKRDQLSPYGTLPSKANEDDRLYEDDTPDDEEKS
jgi:hypothetical protein